MSEIKVNSIKGVAATTAALSINNTDGTCTANITNNLSNRNVIINGAAQVNQRGNQTSLTSSVYVVDRFTTRIGAAGTWPISQVTDSPDGFGNSIKYDCTTATSTPSFLIIQQRIEGQNLQAFAKGTSAAKQFAVSFYVKTNKSGVYTVELKDDDNDRVAAKTITVSDANWNRYTVIFPADTTGAFDNDSSTSLNLSIWLAASSTYTSGTFNSSSWSARVNANRISSSNVNLADSTSNEFLITGVQLEVGSVATDFEHRSFAQELALCHRYCQKFGGGNGTYDCMAIGSGVYNTQVFTPYRLLTTMRSTPSFTLLGSASDFIIKRDGSNYTPSSVALDVASTSMMAILYTVSTGISNDEGIRVWNNNNTGGFLFTAEL